VKDFGAVGDGVADDTAAIQAAVDHCLNNNIGSLFFPFQQGERYKLTSTINITRGDFELFGSAGNANNLANTGYIFSTISGAVLFNYGNNTSIGGAFTCRGLNFKATYWFTTPQTAFKFSDSSDGPARAVTFRDCSFYGFNNALLFDTPGGTLAPSFVDIQDCNFRDGQYAINALDQVIGLRFVANQAEGGARIKGNITGWATVTNNLIEGQGDFLDLGGVGGCSVTFADNYVEANNDNFLVSVNYSNASTTVVKVGHIYTGTGSRLDDVYISSGGTVFVESRRPSSEAITIAPGGWILPGSRGFASGYKVYLPSTASNSPGSLLPADEFTSTYSSADAYLGGNGAVTGLAPHGSISTITEITTNAYSGYQALTKTIAVGDAIIISYLVRIKGTNAGSSYSTIQVLDQAFNLTVGGGSVEGISDVHFINSNKWFLMTTTFLAQNAASGLRFRIQPYPGLVGSASPFQIGGVAVKTFTPGGSRFVTKPIYPYI
jgi:hypothetical protein